MKFTRLGMALFLILGLTLSAPAFQTTTGAIEGFVKTSDTGEIVSNVKIILVFTQNESIKHEFKTDKRGHYYKAGLTPGIYKISIEKEGFLPASGTIRVKLGSATEYDFELDVLENLVPESLKLGQKGLDLLNEGKNADAIDKFTQGIAEDNTNPALFYYRGLAYERQGELDLALADYQKSIELKPDFALPFARSGISYAKQKNYEKACEYYQQALDLGDSDVTTYYNYGAVLMNQGKSQEAKIVFEKLLELDENYADALYQLGIISLGLGESGKAKVYLERFVEMDPENNNAAIAKKILDSLK